MSDMEQPGESLDSDLPNTAESEHDEPNPAGDQLEGEGGEVEPPEEEDEIEVDGRKFALPKSAAEKIKAGFMKDADYTRKTQEVAAQRQAVEAQRAEVEKARETQQQFIKEMAKVEALTDQLAQYEKVDWNALRAQDLDAYLEHQEIRRTLETQRNAAQEAVTQKQQQFALDEQQAIAKQVQDAEAYVQREIPGGEARTKQLHEYAAKEGVKFDPLVAKALISNPALFKMMHKAELYDQLAQKQAAKQPAPPPPRPATRVSAAKQGAQRNPEDMSMDEWAAHRNAQLKRNR